MDNDRNWIRLLAAVEGFAVRHGSWPTRVRLPAFVRDDLQALLTAGSWQRLTARLQVVVDDAAPVVAEDEAGRRFSYGDEGPAAARSVPSAEDWLGVAPVAASAVALLEARGGELAAPGVSEGLVEGDCPCWRLPIAHAEFESRPVGVDETGGRFAEVSVEHCRRCGQEWLRYFFDLESESGSGRWYQAAITTEEAASVAASTAVEVLGRRNWHFYGGSYFGTPGARREARLDPRRL